VAQPAAVGLSAPTNATVSPGGIALAVDDAAHLVGGDIVLSYDPFVATASDARATSLSANLNIEFNVPVAGQARISLKPKTGYEGGLAGGSGALVEIKFTGSASAAHDSVPKQGDPAARIASPGTSPGGSYRRSARRLTRNTRPAPTAYAGVRWRRPQLWRPGRAKSCKTRGITCARQPIAL
jgi:hypothetical protein